MIFLVKGPKPLILGTFKTARMNRFYSTTALMAMAGLGLAVFACPFSALAQTSPQINGGMTEEVAPPPSEEGTAAGTQAPAEAPPNLLDESEADTTGARVISTGTAAPPAASTTAAPPQTNLASPAAPAAVGPAKEVVPAPAVPVSNDPDLFFDAESIVPTGEMGTKAPGPRPVNPATQPASRLIVVDKTAKPGSQQAQLVAANRAMKLGRYDAALEIYDALYAKNDKDPNILMGRAVALQYLGQYDEAMLTYQKLIDIKPDYIEAKINMLGLLSTKYPAVALRELLDLNEEKPNDVAVISQVAVTEAQLGNLGDALKYLGMAASMEPHNAGHLYNMGIIADRAGKMTEAVQYYEKALEIDAVYGRSQSIPRDAVYERLARIR